MFFYFVSIAWGSLHMLTLSLVFKFKKKVQISGNPDVQIRLIDYRVWNGVYCNRDGSGTEKNVSVTAKTYSRCRKKLIRAMKRIK